MTLRRPIGALVFATALVPVGARAQSAGDVVREAAQGSERAAAAQDRIDAVADDRDALAAEYRAALDQTRALRVYARQLRRLLESQHAELARLDEQIDDVAVVARQIMPLMARMVDGLEAFVELDLPFLPDERRRRIVELRELMTRADVTIADKYRRILEAYQAEHEYGRTLEAYRATLSGPEGGRTVDFLHVGRIGLFYQTLDGAEAGRWNPASRTWDPLPGHRVAIDRALAMARQRAAPDLVTLPVPAPEDAE